MVVRLIGVCNEEQIIVKINKTSLDAKNGTISLIGVDGTRYLAKASKKNIRKTYDALIDELFVKRKATLACESFDEIPFIKEPQQYEYFYMENDDWKEK